MRNLNSQIKFKSDIEKFEGILNDFIAQQDFNTVKRILRSRGKFLKDDIATNRYSNLFMTDARSVKFFGIGSKIINSMKNVVFSGNVNLKVDKKQAQKFLDEIYFDGHLINALKELYTSACVSNKGLAYLFFNTSSVYTQETNVKVKDKFIKFEVFKDYEIEEEFNKITRIFYKDVKVVRKEKEVFEEFKFEYEYEFDRDNEKTYLTIRGYDELDIELDDSEVKRFLGIDDVYEIYDFQPIWKLDLNEGLLKDIVFVEDSLAQSLYFQDIDLSNSQTKVYTPENLLGQVTDANVSFAKDHEDRFKTNYKIKRSSLGETPQLVVAGNSSIKFIQDNITMKILEACTTAKISPRTIGYTLIDKTSASNTDVGTEQERNTIRLRETHINILKPFIAKILKTFLMLHNHKVDVKDITVVFDNFITPSLETMINNYAKATQFGIMSRRKAVTDINKGELSEEEIDKELEEINKYSVQQDFNVEQRLNKEANEKPSEKVDLKEDNVLKSTGIVE